MHSFESKNPKVLAWENALEQIEKLERPELEAVRPSYELRVDENIKQAVAAFNVNGFNTLMSCEGHTDHGSSVPYIDMQDTIPPESADSQEFVTWKQKKDELFERMRLLINEFNADRQSPDFAEIVILNAPGTSRVSCRGDEEVSPLEVNDKDSWGIDEQGKLMPKILRCREEMNAFTEFLKRKFFESV